ncbi:MAG TPA: hypothetical protein VE465_17930 [Streptosporangiaceae bacterium]|nr:hypothetical protein [Streptosporangiaceae bacterium]
MIPSTQQSVARPPEPRPAGARSRSRALPTTAIVVAVAGALTAVTWVTGGWRSQSATPPPRVAPGGSVDQGRFDVQVINARTERTKVGLDNALVPAIIVRMRVTNTGEDTVMIDNGTSGFSAGVLLGPAPGRRAEGARNDPAKGPALTLQPRVPRGIDLIWRLKGTPPAQVTLNLHEWVRQLEFDHGGYLWLNGKDTPIAATVTVPVRQGGIG